MPSGQLTVWNGESFALSTDCGVRAARPVDHACPLSEHRPSVRHIERNIDDPLATGVRAATSETVPLDQAAGYLRNDDGRDRIKNHTELFELSCEYELTDFQKHFSTPPVLEQPGSAY
jgi:hypothetical protein